MTQEQHLQALRGAGLLESSQFRALRAFGVEEMEDEGLHYFLELDDRRVLFLSGQYLYDFEPIADEPDDARPRQFPCTEFTVERHRTEGYVANIVCAGRVLEPEALAKAFRRQDWPAGLVPEDGEIIANRAYDEIKAALLGRTG